MADFDIKKLAVPSVCLLISFLAYSSPYLFLSLEPGPLSGPELVKFNLLVACLWICYARACKTNPGRVPPSWNSWLQPKTRMFSGDSDVGDNIDTNTNSNSNVSRRRTCHRCRVLKPPRAHHCKICGRCIPKMDHHCPWTGNCVSHLTFPHFIRFLFYAVASMCYLEHLIYVRCAILWGNRTMPSYLGPSMGQLIHLFVLAVVNSFTLFMLSIMLIRTVWSLGGNITTIESWEIARHKRLLRRSRVFGGYLDGPDGIKVKIEKQEFPYDIGIWANFKQGMGTANIFIWLSPFASTPADPGIDFEVNEFDDPFRTWPPPDPDRIPRLQRPFNANQQSFKPLLTGADEIAAFKERQDRDLYRRQQQQQQQPSSTASTLIRRKPFNTRHSTPQHPAPQIVAEKVHQNNHHASHISSQSSESGEEGWRNPDGERLADYGVDEDVEFYDQANHIDHEIDPNDDEDDDDEDNIPLSELIRRRRATGQGTL